MSESNFCLSNSIEVSRLGIGGKRFIKKVDLLLNVNETARDSRRVSSSWTLISQMAQFKVALSNH